MMDRFADTEHQAIDKGIAAFLEALQTQPQAADISTMRDAALAARKRARDGLVPDAERSARLPAVRDVEIAAGEGALRGLCFTPPGGGSGLIAYFHGGGWSLLSAETHAPIMQQLAEAAGSMVIGPDMPLAPELRFPDLLDACVGCIEGLRTAPETAARCAEGLILAGDSSGANLALAVSLSLRDAGRPMPDALILAYGVVDCDFTRESYALYGAPPYPLSAERMELFWSFYCGDEADRSHALASPLRADLGGLPPTRIVIAEQDVLRDENVALADKMERSGVAVARDHVPAATHAFWEACLHSDVSAGSIAAAGRWARGIVHRNGGGEE